MRGLFTREGASVVVASRSEKHNQQTVRMIEDVGGRALAVTCDVTRSEEVRHPRAKRRAGRDRRFSAPGAIVAPPDGSPGPRIEHLTHG